ncbi:MAG: hypothetical protein OSA48_11990 [Akkermansiaceae bacterium]|nr:hypothetical protein [Akkermansiaceae bacterium]
MIQLVITSPADYERGLKRLTLLALPLSLLVSAEPESRPGDWRLDLLKEEGLEVTEAALKRSLAEFESPPEGLEEAYQSLGVDEFKQREEAQAKLLRGGRKTLDWLNDIEPSPDPEVRLRVAEIRKQLNSPQSSGRENAIRHAVRSLLSPKHKNAPDTGGMIHEWFSQNAKTLEGNYRHFTFQSTSGRGAQVGSGILVMPGKDGNDGDQQLVLAAKGWPGQKDFGKSFRVSAKTGGKPGGVGAWHLGISIGNVRALYHPDLAGGGFRFEEHDKRPYLTQNENMGFTPSSDTMQWMSVDVHRLANDKVKLEVTVEQGESGPGRFQRSLIVDAKAIGDLTRISLDRSGRTGGAAIFDDLTVDLRTP